MVNKKLPFGFGIDANGKYGYIVSGEDGADTVIPFSETYRIQVIGALKNTNLKLTKDSTWNEIIDGLYSLFPESLDVLAYLGVNSINKSGDASYTSKEFDITNFNTLTVTCNYGQSDGTNTGGEHVCNLVTTKGNISLLGTESINISGYTGKAYISIRTTSITKSGWDPSKPYENWGEHNSTWGCSGYVNLTKCILQI